MAGPRTNVAYIGRKNLIIFVKTGMTTSIVGRKTDVAKSGGDGLVVIAEVIFVSNVEKDGIVGGGGRRGGRFGLVGIKQVSLG